MSLRAKILAAVVGALGIMAVAIGGFVSGYSQAVLLQLGSAFLLAAPLFFLERVFQARIKANQRATEAVTESVGEMRESVRDVTYRLDQLATATRDGMSQIAAEDSAVRGVQGRSLGVDPSSSPE